MFFSEEKNQKTFVHWGYNKRPAWMGAMNKSLLLLFFRKEDLSSLANVQSRASQKILARKTHWHGRMQINGQPSAGAQPACDGLCRGVRPAGRQGVMQGHDHARR
jgi:hypothetical protein